MFSKKTSGPYKIGFKEIIISNNPSQEALQVFYNTCLPTREYFSL